MSAKASGSSANANGDARSRTNNDSSANRVYTVEQKAAVVRVRRCTPTAFYDILGLEEVKASCTDNEIKKAYRKLSLLTHPDKNGYDGADEAFKMVSRAFQILSDAEKKAKYDRFGGDPDNRFANGSAAASPFSSAFRSPGASRGQMWEEEISPEELFRQFFGGGMGGGFGGPFGTGSHPLQSFFAADTFGLFPGYERSFDRSFDRGSNRSVDRNVNHSFQRSFNSGFDIGFGFSSFSFGFSSSSYSPSAGRGRRTRGPDPYQFL